MFGIPIIDGLLFISALLLSMVTTMAMSAVTSASRNRLELLADTGNEAAKKVLRLKDAEERLLGSVEIAVMLFMVLALLVMKPYFVGWFGAFVLQSSQTWDTQMVRILIDIAAAAILVFVFLAIGMLFGKSIGLHFADAISLKLSGMMLLLIGIMSVPQRILMFCTNLLLKPFGTKAQFGDSVTTEEELMDILEEGTKSGLLNQTEHELIESIFQFTDTTAREIMIPRKDIIGINNKLNPEEILELIVEEGFTRMPVFEESLDHIVGVVYAKDVLSLIEHKDLIILEDITRDPFIVPETKPISELLREFQRKRIHLAVVVDEFGGTEGIITMEDILEEIVGDIRDEYDEEMKSVELLPGGIVEAEGMLNITDFNEYVEFHIPESSDYDTIGGFITMQFGRIPEPGDRFMYHSLEIEVLEVEERRVKRVRFFQPDEDLHA